MDYQILKTELQSSAYAGMTDAQAATAVSAKTVSHNVPVDVVTATNWLRQQGIWYAIKKAASNNDAAYAAVDLVSDMRVQTIDFSLPIVVQMGAALVSASLMTQAQWDALAALAVQSTLWVQETLGVPYVSAADVAVARAL